MLANELEAKRLQLLHQLVPQAQRIAVLVNPASVNNSETTLRDVEAAARTIGLQLQVLKANQAAAPPPASGHAAAVPPTSGIFRSLSGQSASEEYRIAADQSAGTEGKPEGSPRTRPAGLGRAGWSPRPDARLRFPGWNFSTAGSGGYPIPPDHFSRSLSAFW
jgi:hypothetical protein